MRELLMIIMLSSLACQQDEIIVTKTKKVSIDASSKQQELNLVQEDSTQKKKVETQCSSDSDCSQGQKCVSKTCTKTALERRVTVDPEQHSDYIFINRRTDTWR